MKSFSRFALALMLIVLLIGLGSRIQIKSSRAARQKEGNAFVTNIYGETLSWKTTLPIGFHIHSSVPSDKIPVIQQAMDTWEKALGKKMFVIIDSGVQGSKSESQLRDNRNTIYDFGSGEWKGTPEDQAKTLISWVGDQIQEADILINSDNHEFFTGVGHFAPSQVDLQSALVHEFGHVLGLNHIDSRPSAMSTWLARGEKRRNPFKEDVAALLSEYQ
jgi:hypothetical protein